MTYLHRDPRTGIYHHRRAVPVELRDVIGKREIKRSLGTKEPKEARLAEGRPVAKTEHEWHTAFRRLTEVIGEDVPARAVTKAHVRNFKDALLQCPSRMRKSLRRRALPDIVEITKGQDAARLSPASVNKALGAVSAVFSWAVTRPPCSYQ